MNTIESKLVSYITNLNNLEAAFLFGSEASGHTHSRSDVDIAILFRIDNVPGTNRLLKIQDELTSLLKKETDIVVLNNASPIIRMQVLRKGKKLIVKNRKAYSSFFVRTINEYADLKKVRSVIENKITKGRIYG